MDTAADPASIKLLILDIDGVMTDGSIIIDSDGRETKRFHVRDGLGIVAWKKLGLSIGVITGRPSVVTTLRCRELGIDLLEQVPGSEKLSGLHRILQRTGLDAHQVAMIGDDLPDLPVLRRVGYPITVADGVAEVRSIARFITPAPGGHGAVRQAIEHLLRAMGRWDEVLELHGG
jgi:YrbI family 3-deoxy-D-manno-octulosonate 8-phosphate phosphatase